MILQYDGLPNDKTIGDPPSGIGDQQPVDPDCRQQFHPTGEHLGRMSFVGVNPALQHDNAAAVAVPPGNPPRMAQRRGPRQKAEPIRRHRLLALKPVDQPPQPGSQNHPQPRSGFRKPTTAQAGGKQPPGRLSG